MTTMTAKYDGRCARCRGPISRGERIQWEPGRTMHATPCEPAKPVQMAPAAVGDGIYTAVYGEAYQTIRIKTPGKQSRFCGRTMVGEYKNGRSTMVGFLSGADLVPWGSARREHPDALARVRRALEVVVADPAKAGEAYALASGNCYRCNRTLTVPASISRGVGPDCAEILGIAA